MPEEDYEVDEHGKKKIHKLRLGVEELMASSVEDKSKKKSVEKKRKRSPSPPLKSGKRKSGRSPAVFQKKTRAEDEESEDLTKDMEDPQVEPNITEVKPSTSSSGPATPTTKKDPELMPIKVRENIISNMRIFKSKFCIFRVLLLLIWMMKRNAEKILNREN